MCLSFTDKLLSRNRVVIASIVRLILLVAFYFKHSVDLTNNLLLPWFMTVAEIGVGIVGACLPCLMVRTPLLLLSEVSKNSMIANQKTQPLYRRFWHDTTGSKPSGYGAQSSLRSHVHGRTTIIAGHHGGKTSVGGADISGHPFERLSTRGTTPEDDVPLHGIHIRHEVTIQRSTMTWDDEGKL